MLLFLIFGIFLFPKINADEIKINQDGSVHWIRDWKEEERQVRNSWDENPTGRTEKILVDVNSEMIYKIDSPLSTAIGRLEKETKIEGCQHIGGCRIILRFGDGRTFYEETIETSIDKIEIDLDQIPQIQELKGKSCESFLINIMLELPKSSLRRCFKAFTETYYNRNETRPGGGQFHRKSQHCQVSLGAWEYNLLTSWVEAYSKELIQPSYDENRIVIKMGPASEFSWCGLSNQKLSLIMRNYQNSPPYCKQINDWEFNLLDGEVKIDIENFTDCNDNNTKIDLDPESFQCLDWEDIEMTISLRLEQCHLNLRQKPLPQFLDDVYSSTCKTHNDTCSWEKVEYSRHLPNTHRTIHPHFYECIEKNHNITFPSTAIPFHNVHPLKATKTTGRISTREEEDSGMIILSDSEDNLECLNKQFEIRSLGLDVSTKEIVFDKNYSIPKSELYPDDCLEHVKTLHLKTLSTQAPDFTETFETFLTIGNLSKTQDGKLKFKFLDGKYEKCLQPPSLHLLCMNEERSISSKTIAGLEIESGEITGLQCHATAFLEGSSNLQQTSALRPWSECFTSAGPGCGRYK